MTDAVEEDESRSGALAMIGRIARELAILLVLAVPIMSGIGYLRAPSLPEQAPDFELVDLEGNRVALSDLRGQTVVVNFWATWCGPCRVEAPWFSSFATAHPDIPVLGVVADGPPNKARAIASRIGITYPVLVGDEAVLADYGVSMFPTTVVVAPDGSVRWAHAGLMTRPQLAWTTGNLW